MICLDSDCSTVHTRGPTPAQSPLYQTRALLLSLNTLKFKNKQYANSSAVYPQTLVLAVDLASYDVLEKNF